MVMSEEQAKTKWCPHVRTGMVQGMAVNHHVHMDTVHAETRCIASGCMMWREHGGVRGGYCGLAGKDYPSDDDV